MLLESPLSPNPSVEITNPNSLIIKWSPPFLWPGHRIKYFNITVINMSDGSVIAYYRVNTTFSDQVVTLSLSTDDIDGLNCTEFEFRISAISNMTLQLFTIAGGYPSCKYRENKIYLHVAALLFSSA